MHADTRCRVVLWKRVIVDVSDIQETPQPYSDTWKWFWKHIMGATAKNWDHCARAGDPQCVGWSLVCVFFGLPIIQDLGSWQVLSLLIFPPFDLTLFPITTLPWRSLVYPLPGTTLKPVPGRKLESQSNMTSRDPYHHWVVWFYTWLPQELISVWVPMFTKMESLNVKVSKNILKISKRIYRIVTSWNV